MVQTHSTRSHNFTAFHSAIPLSEFYSKEIITDMYKYLAERMFNIALVIKRKN